VTEPEIEDPEHALAHPWRYRWHRLVSACRRFVAWWTRPRLKMAGYVVLGVLLAMSPTSSNKEAR
jgi:hypothetical protein